MWLDLLFESVEQWMIAARTFVYGEQKGREGRMLEPFGLTAIKFIVGSFFDMRRGEENCIGRSSHDTCGLRP